MTILEAGIFGLVFGSFANVAMERIPRRQPLTDRSRCNACRRPLGVFELVPLLSYALLRGRCKSCADPIGARTPAIEAMCGVAFGAAFWALPASSAIVACIAFVALTIAAGALIEGRGVRQ
jgi:leader peptidase (prepilin peptidase)/N-methyltransferase